MAAEAGRIRRLAGLHALSRPPARTVVTVGVFDGVHKAHQQLIRTTTRLARRLNAASVVITFDPDPQRVLDPAHAQPALMPLEARLVHLRELGVDRVWVIPFTRRFSRTTASQFIRGVLIRRLHALALVVGERFVFGRNRQGDMEVLRALGPSLGMKIVPVRHMRLAGAPISSSRIRRLIGSGQLAMARRLLGRAPSLYGVVVRGAGRGRRLGFPTANIQLDSDAVPPRGVYAVMVRSLHHQRAWRGVMNLGVRPTFGPGPLVCEVHVLRFYGTLLGRAVSVSLLARLRSERCFSSPEALTRQVRQDLVRARRFFARPA